MAISKTIGTRTIRINSNPLPLGVVSDYKILNTKTYVTSPVRSNDGSIKNINDYDIFFVPRIIIFFNYIKFEDYIYINDLINSSNEYEISYYDYNSGLELTDTFYLTPEENEKLLYIRNDLKGMTNFSLSFVGTLNKTKQTTIYFYNTNGTLLNEVAVNFGERIKLSEKSGYSPTGETLYWYDTETNVRYAVDSMLLTSKSMYRLQLGSESVEYGKNFD